MSTASASNEPSAEEWPTSSEQFDLLGKIGVGAFATVYRAKTDDGRDCAIKVLNLDHVDTNLAEIRLEVQAMRLSSHDNVLCCHTAFVHDIHLWLVTQLMRKGSSLHCLQSARRVLRTQQQQHTCLMEPHILFIMHETLLGLKYIHDNNTLHRDIKVKCTRLWHESLPRCYRYLLTVSICFHQAGNILLDYDGSVRIADFGVSGWLVQGGSQIEKAKTFVGTPCWMARKYYGMRVQAPIVHISYLHNHFTAEVMEQVHGYDYKADIWSVGITALELAKGYAPYAKFPPMKVLILTIQEDPPNLDSYMDDDADADEIVVTEQYTRLFHGFVAACLQKNPAKRPNCQDLLQSKYFIGLQDEATRRERQEQLRRQICDIVPDVGEVIDQTNDASHARGHTTVSIVLSQDIDRAPGTTWVFADGSQVLSTSATQRLSTIDDVMAELDAFGEQTGGEHYDRTAKSKELSEEFQVVDQQPSDDSQEDDLDAFMDQFEQQTGGENFHRPSNK
jgi:serine/threonine-protein kinase OSR1/STK39